MSLHLFAGLRVRDLHAARPWYERLLGEPTFFPHSGEAVWKALYRDPDGNELGFGGA